MVSNDRPVGQDRSIDRCRLVDQGIYRMINQSILTDRPIIQYHGSNRSVDWLVNVGRSVSQDRSVGQSRSINRSVKIDWSEDRSVLSRSICHQSQSSFIDRSIQVRTVIQSVGQSRLIKEFINLSRSFKYSETCYFFGIVTVH